MLGGLAPPSHEIRQALNVNHPLWLGSCCLGGVVAEIVVALARHPIGTQHAYAVERTEIPRFVFRSEKCPDFCGSNRNAAISVNFY